MSLSTQQNVHVTNGSNASVIQATSVRLFSGSDDSVRVEIRWNIERAEIDRLEELRTLLQHHLFSMFLRQSRDHPVVVRQLEPRMSEKLEK